MAGCCDVLCRRHEEGGDSDGSEAESRSDEQTGSVGCLEGASRPEVEQGGKDSCRFGARAAAQQEEVVTRPLGAWG